MATEKRRGAVNVTAAIPTYVGRANQMGYRLGFYVEPTSTENRLDNEVLQHVLKEET